jgi:CMP-N,N'-diacetyllegionaminic acid synthase
MIAGKKILALTPARGGSKGLPKKNIRSLCGKPLIAHAIDIAKQSRYIDEAIISTDCEEIAQVASKYGTKVDARPPKFATDTALVADTIRDLIDRLDEQFDYMVLLEATSPLRTVELVDNCIEKIVSQKADSLATFSHAEPPPTRLWTIENNLASPFLKDADPWQPRQQQQDAYFLNGLVYVFHIPTWMKSNSKSIYFGKSTAVVTNQLSVDIDTLDDFELAEYLMRSKHETNI